MKPLKHIRHLLLLLLLAQGVWVEAQHYVPINGEIDSLLVLPKLGGDSVDEMKARFARLPSTIRLSPAPKTFWP